MKSSSVSTKTFPFNGSVVNIRVEQLVWDKILEIDLSRVKQKLCIEKSMSEAEANLAINGYRVFLFFSYRAKQEGNTVIPFIMVDEVWHSHILQSVEHYRNEVKEAIGFTLDHISGLPGEQPDTRAIQMGDLVESSYVPMSVHNSEYAQCDGGSCCEADF